MWKARIYSELPREKPKRQPTRQKAYAKNSYSRKEVSTAD